MSDAITPGAAPAPAATPSDTSAPVDVNATASPVVPPVSEPKKDPAPSTSSKKKFNIKVDGKNETLELDVNDEAELIKHLQMSKVSGKRMQEFAEVRKNVQELLETLRTDPLKVIGDPRLNIPEETRKKMAQAIIDNELQELQKTPEQKEKEKNQKEYERLKKELEDTKKAQEDAEHARLTQQYATELDADISEAIEKSGLPKNARTVRYMVEALILATEKGLDLNATDLIPHVKKQTLAEFKELIGALPDDEFESWVGKDRLSTIRKKNATAKMKASLSDIRSTGADAKRDEPKSQKIKMKDFMSALGGNNLRTK